MPKVQIVEPKHWWKSKTLWLNLIAAILIALESQFSLLQAVLPGNVYAWIATALTVANAALRVITTAPLAFGFKPYDPQ